MNTLPPLFTPPREGIEPPAWLEGVRRYQQSGYQRPPCPYNVVWRSGAVRCFNVTYEEAPLLPDTAPVVLLIPSLINRYYILDLNDDLSFARGLRAGGAHVYLLDWSDPTPADTTCDAGDYVTNYLVPLATFLTHLHDSALIPMGYCVGGLLALALTMLHPHMVNRLALLATPWDFHAPDYYMQERSGLHHTMLHSLRNTTPLVSGAYLSWLFYLAEPVTFEEKYRYFATLPEQGFDYQRFLAIEHWVNDTVPLTRAFAHTCLIDWAQHNHTARLKWRVAGEVIDPARITCPTFIAAPRHDRVVRSANALALAHAFSHCNVITPDTGHIGMMIGRNRLESLWYPLQTWIHPR